jgi:hypothetical protein
VSQREPTRLEQRLTDDDRMVRIAILVFGALAVIVLLSIARPTFDPEYCTRLMLERNARGSTYADGACILAFEDGTTESFSPSVWARQSRNLAIATGLGLVVYGYVTRRDDD